MGYEEAARRMADDCLCFRVRRVSRALTRLYDEALRPLGIQATQLTVLNAVALFEAREAPMSEVAEVLAMDVTTLSRSLRPLEKDGLVRIVRSPSDGRVRLPVLTADGRQLLERALPVWTRAQERVEEALGEELTAQLKRGVDAAVAAAEAGAAQVAGDVGSREGEPAAAARPGQV